MPRRGLTSCANPRTPTTARWIGAARCRGSQTRQNKNLSPECVILRELLASESGWVSGARLASKLGVSRVAVWHQMEKLRAQGFVFETRRARGYRVAKQPVRLHAALIEAQIKVRVRGFSLAVWDEIDSTNDEAARQLAAGCPAPFAVFARRQTRGRGRLG